VSGVSRTGMRPREATSVGVAAVRIRSFGAGRALRCRHALL